MNKFLWTILAVVAFVFILISLMPKPIDMNLDEIGDGRIAVVFIYDPNLSISNQQTIELNKAREALGQSANFLVAKIGNPKADTFLKQHNALAPDLLFFSSDGKLMTHETALITSGRLVEILSGLPRK